MEFVCLEEYGSWKNNDENLKILSKCFEKTWLNFISQGLLLFLLGGPTKGSHGKPVMFFLRKLRKMFGRKYKKKQEQDGVLMVYF